MELKTGLIQHISKRTRRITANNPGVFTGPGTNTYLLGDDEVVVIDPGPALETHYDTIIGAAKTIKAVIVTHTHLDHSPGAKLYNDRLGIPIYGIKSEQPYQDRSFNPTYHLEDGQVFETSKFIGIGHNSPLSKSISLQTDMYSFFVRNPFKGLKEPSKSRSKSQV